MCHKILIIVTSFFSFGLTLNSGYAQPSDTSFNNDDIPIYTFDELEPLLYTEDSKIHIINFWAMWCAPCIKELPLFENYAKHSWINKIDPNWSGAIPFTIIFNHKKRSYHERSFENIEDFENEINNTINSK